MLVPWRVLDVHTRHILSMKSILSSNIFHLRLGEKGFSVHLMDNSDTPVGR